MPPCPSGARRGRRPGVRLAFSSRRGGVSPPPRDSLDLGFSTADPADLVRENRRRLLERLASRSRRGSSPPGRCTAPSCAASPVPATSPDCDALLTLAPGLALAVATADCMALLYHAPGAVAAAHAGWRGAAAGVPGATLRALCDAAGVPPDAVRVALGPVHPRLLLRGRSRRRREVPLRRRPTASAAARISTCPRRPASSSWRRACPTQRSTTRASARPATRNCASRTAATAPAPGACGAVAALRGGDVASAPDTDRGL